jgi:hypothetical protein
MHTTSAGPGDWSSRSTRRGVGFRGAAKGWGEMKKLVAAGLVVLAASMWVAGPAEAGRGGGSGGGPGMRGAGPGSGGGSAGWSGRGGWSGGGRSGGGWHGVSRWHGGGRWHGGSGWHGRPWGGRPFVRFGWWGWPGWGWGPGWGWAPYYPYAYGYPYGYGYPYAYGYPYGYGASGYDYPYAPYTSTPAVVQEAPPQPYYWYYCEPAGAYYPYVKECPSGWLKVSPEPPPSDSTSPGPDADR